MLPEKPLFNPQVERAKAFAEACPLYKPTSLVTIEHENHSVFVKNEAERFGLGAFKAVGGVYAVAQLIAEEFNRTYHRQPLVEDYMGAEFKSAASSVSFVCASAGNHGMAVAAGARLFGSKARIYLSEEVPSDFATRLRSQSADVVIAGANYEESLLAAQDDSTSSGRILLADGCFPEPEHPPALVMEGYTVIGAEMAEQFAESGRWPTDVYLQAGVGGMAGALAYMIRRDWPAEIRIVIVEPESATCLASSAAAGEAVAVTGPVSNMGRLDCKAPSVIAFDTLHRSNVSYAKISDKEASAAAELLSTYVSATTPSGAAGFGAWLNEKADGKCRGDLPLIILSEQATS